MKPLSHNPTRRRQQLVFRVGLLLCALLLWKWLSGSSSTSSSSKSNARVKSWAGWQPAQDGVERVLNGDDGGGANGKKKKKSKAIDWNERRDRVRDAFLVSWQAYEQDAWGESSKTQRTPTYVSLLTF
ncbi:hypothetical protein KEM55_008256 [Ascosphaera atra]|nr:hypothetical protein KEM55_008256 [Ascosphaera atra]